MKHQTDIAYYQNFLFSLATMFISIWSLLVITPIFRCLMKIFNFITTGASVKIASQSQMIDIKVDIISLS